MAVNDPNSPEESLRLREYVGVLVRRKWSIIAITLLAVLAALFYAQRQTAMYESTSRVQATITLALNPSTTNNVLGPNMDTESQIVGSEPVTKCASVIMNDPTFRADPTGSTLDLDKLCANDVLAKLEVPTGLDKRLSVTFPQTASVLEISYTDPLKSKAQAGANAFALAYIQYKSSQASAQLDKLRQPLLDQQASLTKEINSLTKEITDATSAATGVKPDAGTVGHIQDLENQRSVLEQRQGTIADELLNLDPSKLNPPQLLLPAKLPLAPVSPNKPLDAVLGLFVGLAFGIGLAFLRERLDDSLRGRSDLEENIGVPVLAVIPAVRGWRKRQEPKLVSLEHRKSAVAEAYRTLRTSVSFMSVQRGVKTIMVVSATAGEGKTTTAANLAVSLADANRRVILVSADLRKPRVHRFFGLSNDTGLSNALTGELKPWETLQDPNVENLRVMPSGPVPARPAELLQSEQMGELLAELREVSDFVIIDTAPVLLVADALALAALVDGVLFVADSQATSRSAVAHAREQLEQVGAPLIGAVYNNYDPSKGRTYYPYSGYYGPYRYRYGRYEGYYSTPTNGDAKVERGELTAPTGPPPERSSS